MTTNITKTFSITIECDEHQADVICRALHEAYRPIKDERDYCDETATTLRIARNAFASAIGRTYMGEDS